jgi:MFS family permease
LSWRWVFYVNVPFGIASLALVGFFFRENVEKKTGRIDWLGAAVLTALVLALLAAAHGRGAGTAALVAAVPLALLLVFVELRASDPVLPVPLFRRRVMWVTAVASAASGGAMFCTVTYVPLLVQAVMRGTPTEAGGAIAPMLVAWPLASFLAGRFLPRTGFRPLIRLGLVVSCVALFALAWFVDHHPSLWPLRLASAAFGFGMGFSTTSLVIAVQTSVDWQERGVATAGALFSRIMGGTLAVGALGGLLTRALLADRSIPEHAADELLGPHRGAGLDPEMLDRIAEALTGGLVTIFWVTAALGALALAVGVLFPRVSTTSSATEPR